MDAFKIQKFNDDINETILDIPEFEHERLVNKVYLYNDNFKNIICCIEEMSELTKVLTKEIRKSPKFKKEDLTEEISHVFLMCSVMCAQFNISYDDILKIEKDAVKRMESNIQ